MNTIATIGAYLGLFMLIALAAGIAVWPFIRDTREAANTDHLIETSRGHES